MLAVMTTSSLRMWLSCGIFTLHIGFVHASPQESIQQSISGFHTTLTTVMQMNGNYKDRFNKLSPVIRKLFDAPNISRISTGKYWREQDVQLQERFTDLVYELIAATYADRFVSYNDQVFSIDSVESKGKNRWVVKSRLTKSDGEIVTLDYYLRSGVVFNVVANGVSDLSLKRADYTSILAQHGFSGLIAHIERNILDYRQHGVD